MHERGQSSLSRPLRLTYHVTVTITLGWARAKPALPVTPRSLDNKNKRNYMIAQGHSPGAIKINTGGYWLMISGR